MADKKEAPETSSRRPGFESGNCKIYVALETLKYHDSRSLVQIGAVSSKSDVNFHLAITPGNDLFKRASQHFLGTFHWRNIKSIGDISTAQFEKEDGTLVDTVSRTEGIKRFLQLLKNSNPPVTLVFYSVTELRELVWEVQNIGHLDDLDIYKLVSTVVVYEIHLDERKRKIDPLNQLLDVTANVYSADKLATLLRQLFACHRRSAKDFGGYPMEDKLPKSRISIPEFKDLVPRYLPLSCCRLSAAKSEWLRDPVMDPDRPFPPAESQLNKDSAYGVTVFRSGVFGFRQPILVKLWKVPQGATSIDYTAILEEYRGKGTSPIFRYSSVDYGIVILENQESSISQMVSTSVLKVKDTMKYVPHNSRISYAKHYGKQLISSTENIQVDIVFHSEEDKGVSLMSEPFSVLVKLVPAADGKNEVPRHVFSSDQVFITTKMMKAKTFTLLNPILSILQDNLARLVILPNQEVTMSRGTKLGEAVLINQENFKQALSAGFMHELEIKKLIEEPSVQENKENARQKRRREQEDGYDDHRKDGQKSRTRQNPRRRKFSKEDAARHRGRNSDRQTDSLHCKRDNDRYSNERTYYEDPYYQGMNEEMETGPDFNPSNIPDNYLFSRRSRSPVLKRM